MSGTSTTKFTAATTVPNQESWGHYQRWTFSNNDPHVRIQAFSQFVPTSFNNSTINIESRNYNYAGFRWHHTTKSTDVNSFGSFTFQSFISDGAGTDIFGFDGTNFNIYSPVFLNNNLDMGTSKITNVATGVSSTDAANVGNITSAISAGTITLTGNVTGSGTIGTSFAATLALRLNQIIAPNASVSMSSQKLTSLANGTVSADAVNLGQMNTAISSAISVSTITLTGNVTGSGTVGTPFATTIVSKLNQIPIPTGAVNINSQDIGSVGNLGIGVASPTFPIQFPNATADCKIALFPGAGNNFQVYGFGVLGSTLKYSVDSSASSHVFYCGASSTTSTELFRIAGTGYATVSGGDGTFYSRVPSVHISLTSGGTTTTPSGSWTKINGTTSATSGAVQFTTSSNRITFTGSDLGTSCTGFVSASLNVAFNDTSGGNFGIYKNGTTLIANTYCWGDSVTAGIALTVVIPSVMVTLSPGDYLEIWGVTTSAIITTSYLNLGFHAC